LSMSGILIILVVIGTFLYGLYVGSGSFTGIGNEVQFEVLELHGAKVINSKIVGVNGQDQGVVERLITEIRPNGSGLVLVNVNDVLADVQAQLSARVAVQVAKNFTKMDLSEVDIIFHIKANAGVVGGQSAGSTMAISLIAGLLDKELREDIIMTGSINPDGAMGNAGKIKEKAFAARDAGAKIFVIPPAYDEEVYTYKKVKGCKTYDIFEYCEVKYAPNSDDLQGVWGIKVVQVDNIKDIIEIYFKEDETQI